MGSTCDCAYPRTNLLVVGVQRSHAPWRRTFDIRIELGCPSFSMHQSFTYSSLLRRLMARVLQKYTRALLTGAHSESKFQLRGARAPSFCFRLRSPSVCLCSPFVPRCSSGAPVVSALRL